MLHHAGFLGVTFEYQASIFRTVIEHLRTYENEICFLSSSRVAFATSVYLDFDVLSASYIAVHRASHRVAPA